MDDNAVSVVDAYLRGSKMPSSKLARFYRGLLRVTLYPAFSRSQVAVVMPRSRSFYLVTLPFSVTGSASTYSR